MTWDRIILVLFIYCGVVLIAALCAAVDWVEKRDHEDES